MGRWKDGNDDGDDGDDGGDVHEHARATKSSSLPNLLDLIFRMIL